MTLDRWDGPTIVTLCPIAKAIYEHIRQGEDGKLEALQTVCEVTEAQFQKIYDRLKAEVPQSSKTLRYVGDGLRYTGHLKRTYQETMMNNVEENAESVAPMEQPSSIASSSKKNIGETPANPGSEAMEFVEDYMKKKIGKMNWNACWQEGLQQGKLTSLSFWTQELKDQQ